MGIQSPGFRVEPGMTRVFQSLQFEIIFAKLEAGMKKIVVWTIFYLVTLLLIGVLWGLFYPAASVLIKLAQSQKRGVSILIPLFPLIEFSLCFFASPQGGEARALGCGLRVVERKLCSGCHTSLSVPKQMTRG